MKNDILWETLLNYLKYYKDINFSKDIQINETTSLVGDLNMDSLDICEVIFDIENKAELSFLEEPEFDNIHTVGDLYNAVEKGIGPKRIGTAEANLVKNVLSEPETL